MTPREIKFQAWDEGLAEMLPFDLQNISDNLDHQCLSEYLEGGQVMQYTGLKDRNGKEIYEGDIVKLYTNITPEPVGVDVGQIKWQFGCFEFTGKEYMGNVHSYDSAYLEVIGDIYSTPHLLKP